MFCCFRIIDNVRGEINKRQWIIFDGDVDPEWVENLNSVLDDNKLLTLPNGERLGIPPNVRLVYYEIYHLFHFIFIFSVCYSILGVVRVKIKTQFALEVMEKSNRGRSLKLLI